jgi:hypothetical protein
MSAQLQSLSFNAGGCATSRCGLLQRKCDCGTHTIGGGECDDCGKQRLQRSAAEPAQSMQVHPIVNNVLRSPGEPLDSATRAFMEPRFGHDFSNVRIHVGTAAASAARSVQASAYTVGQDIVFGGGFSPHTSGGREVIAHELVHVVQQSGSSPAATLRVDSADSEAEREAAAVARDVVTMNTETIGRAPAIKSGGSVQMLSRAPTFAADCHEYNRCKVVEPLKAANQLLDRVIAELPPLAGGAVTEGRVVDLLNVHFHDPSNVSGRAGIVLNNFRAIKSELNATIRFVCHPPAQECATTEGVVGAFTNDQPGGDISLCTGYHGADCTEQARMLIHEVCHHIPATAIDRAYVHQPNYATLSADQATQNPDTYAQFSKMVFLGTPACKDCSQEVQFRPGQY